MDGHFDTSFILLYPVPELVQACSGAVSSRASLFLIHLYFESEAF